jgi:hypothetical protein
VGSSVLLSTPLRKRHERDPGQQDTGRGGLEQPELESGSADLIAIGIALKEGRIAPDEALEELEAIDLVRIIRPTIPGVSP